MGCSAKLQQNAFLPDGCHSTVSKFSRKVTKSLCLSEGSYLFEDEEARDTFVVDSAPEEEALHSKSLSGPPSTLLEARFDPKCSRCATCGNTGLGLEGRFCKCPYGCRNPLARLHEGDVEVDVGPIHFIGSDGQAQLPRMKLGIRGPYVYEVGGRHSAALPTWSHTYIACAAMGPTWSHILEQVQLKAPCPSAKGLLEAMPQILAAVHRIINVNITEECDKAQMSYPFGEDHLNAHGVVYAFTSSISSELFLASLDTAGYNSIVCKGDGLQELGLKMRLSVSHDRRTVRVSMHQASSGTGFDGIIKLRTMIPLWTIIRLKLRSRSGCLSR